jgi:hypothetical protein
MIVLVNAFQKRRKYRKRIVKKYSVVNGYITCTMYMYTEGSKNQTSLVARSSRRRCAQHLRRIRGCDASIRRESGACTCKRLCHANVTHKIRVGLDDVRHVAPRVARTCRATRDVTSGPLYVYNSITTYGVIKSNTFTMSHRYYKTW